MSFGPAIEHVHTDGLIPSSQFIPTFIISAVIFHFFFLLYFFSFVFCFYFLKFEDKAKRKKKFK